MTHLIDRLAPIGFRLDRRSTVFPEGWGDPADIALFDGGLTAADPIPELDLRWSRKEEHPGFRVRRCRFTSPVADLLPAAAGAVTVEWIEPATGSERIVVLMPAWNDEVFSVRRRLATVLTERSIASFIADVPHYGERRTRPDREPAVGTVGDFAALGYGAVVEARALLGAASNFGTPGVSGYSMGGTLAAIVSATMPRPVAVAPLAAAPGPAPVLLEGAMRRAVRWDALGGRETAVSRLADVLGEASVLRLPPLPHHRGAVVVSAERDGFVFPRFSRALAAHWDSELRTVARVGHGTLLWRHRDILADAIRDSFERIERGHGAD